MDSDFWASRLAAAKRQFHHQHQLHAASNFDRLNWGDFDVEGEARTDVTCPYCYDEFDLGSLCNHLEDEHSSESRPTVCPICAVKVCSDLLSHITQQHGYLFKRRRRLRNLLGRDAHLHILPEVSGHRTNNASTINDPFLSSLVLNLPPENISTPEVSLNDTTQTQPWKPSYDPCLSSEERERMTKRASGRARFVQDLLFCTFLQD